MAASEFYSSLPGVTEFRRITDRALYAPVPADWFLALTDVAGSTEAIADGRYRDVNRAGGIAVMALGNLFMDLDLPFVFGGDGVLFALPPEAMAQAQDVLADTRKLVKDAFGLTLRVGFVPVAELAARGHTLEVAKFQVSGMYNQAMFAGDGVAAAEELVKQPGSAWLLADSHPRKGIADFNGFSCRWRDIASPKGETLSLIVRPRGGDVGMLDRVLEEIARVTGGDDAYHPLSIANMIPAGGEAAKVEARVGAGGGWRGFVRRLAVRLQLKLGWHLIRTGKRGKVQVNGYDIVDIREHIVASCDYRKFDGSLKMVIACTPSARKKIQAWLECAREAGELDYGLHVSDRALLTCAINEGSAREVHFVDAADGGYALAAKMLKERMQPAPAAGA